MKKTTGWSIQAICVTFFCGLIIQTSLQAGGIPWRTNLKAAAKESKQTEKMMLLKVTADWCFYCKKMKKSFNQKSVAKQINDCFVPVLVNADKHPKLVEAIGVEGLPTTVILTSNYKIVKKITGYKNATDLKRELEKFCQANHIQVARQPRVARQERFVPPKKHFPFSQPIASTPSSHQLQQTEGTNPFKSTQEEKTTGLKNPFEKTGIEEETQTNRLAAVSPAAPNFPDMPVPVPVVEDVKTKFAFSGLCLVSLLDEQFLTEGTEDFTSEHHGVTLCFVSKKHKELFEKDPQKYWPVLDGACVISQIDDKTKRQGDPETGAVYHQKLWFFSSVEQRQKFANSPKKYMLLLEKTR